MNAVNPNLAIPLDVVFPALSKLAAKKSPSFIKGNPPKFIADTLPSVIVTKSAAPAAKTPKRIKVVSAHNGLAFLKSQNLFAKKIVIVSLVKSATTPNVTAASQNKSATS